MENKKPTYFTMALCLLGSMLVGSLKGNEQIATAIKKDVILWDVNKGTEIRKFSGHTNRVTTIAFSSDGKLMVSGDSGGKIMLWDVETGKIKQKITAKEWVRSVTFDNDASFIVGVSAHAIQLWNTKTGKEITGNKFKKGISNMGMMYAVLSPNNKYIATILWGAAKIQLWDVKTGSKIKEFGAYPAQGSSILFSPDSSEIFTAGQVGDFDFDGIKVWNLKGDEITENRFTKEHTSHITRIAMKGNKLLSGEDNKKEKNKKVILWNADTGQKIREFSGITLPIKKLVFSPNSNLIACGAQRLVRGEFIIWNAETGQTVQHKKFRGALSAIAFRPIGIN